MPYTAGIYTAPANSWNPAVAGSSINATDWAALLADLITALSTCVLKDGTQTLTANIPMGGFKFTGAAAASANGQYLRYDESAGLVTTSGDFLIATGSAAFARASAANAPLNLTLTASQDGSKLTVAIKGRDGNDPSATNPVFVPLRSATATTGDYSWLKLTSATSIVTTVGGTFGVANSVAFRLWVVAFNDGGTFRLGLINCLTTATGAGAGRDVTAIFPLAQFGVASSTQIGAGSTSAGVFYTSGGAAASKAYTVLGYLTYESGLATAGTFGVDESRLDLFRSGMPLPGQFIQLARNGTGAVATGTTVIPDDDTIPQSAEGDQYLSQAITPSSAANALVVDAQLYLASSAGVTTAMGNALFQDATANALVATQMEILGVTSARNGCSVLKHSVLAATTSATTFKVRAGAAAAGTTTFNGSAGARLFGGVHNSYLSVAEVMA